ncbi:MAG: SMC family ATPase [Acidimicrobiales bacterium]
MLIKRLYARNYRVYEDELNLEMPSGLVGIVGPNGAGKSALLESILWSLYGYSRTSKEEVRTAGVNGDCVTEVEFEHEDHLYLVRRTLSGINSTVRAQAEADGSQVAEGVQAVRSYVHSVLGMDAVAFRASVFAEQKQLASFSALRPGERKDLVLRLLGVTPLDHARDEARRHARVATDTLERLRQVLPDVDVLAAAADDAAAAVAARVLDATTEAEVAAAARATLQRHQSAVDRLEALRREHEDLVAEGRTVRAGFDAATAELVRLDADAAELAALSGSVAEMEVEAAGLEAAESRLALLSAVDSARRALATIAVPLPPQGPAEEECEAALAAARTDAEEVAAATAEVAGRLRGAVETAARADEALRRAAALSAGAGCPLCGQDLGDAFAQVQAHRTQESCEAAARVEALTGESNRLAATAAAARRRTTDAATALQHARSAWAAQRDEQARRSAGEQALARAETALGGVAVPGELADVAAAVRRHRAAAVELARARAKLERQDALDTARDAARHRVGDSRGRLDALRDKVRVLGFQPAALASAGNDRDAALAVAEAAAAGAQRAEVLAGEARIRAEAGAEALARGQAQHAALVSTTDEAHHLARLAALLGAFRDSVVSTVGPRLSAGAAELFAELTDHEYDRLEVDPLTYEIQIRDGGRLYGMARFSGSETDLANMALRVAISEHVRLLSGGSVGLLVLDEVFGPLDGERKQRMLAALERLKSRFRQVLVVTHDDAIKAELPSAIEVVRLPGRRATAHLIT